ncbi:MAG: patatin-like phospholipase family protein, partial [Xanthomonadales bacterium]|nr:patatin-like phospholipase family protein [Xanthomonadales bacterium]
VRGRLQVWVEPQSGSSDPARLMGEVVSGESVGEISLLSDERRSASIRAIRDSLLIRIDRESFNRLAERHPSLVMSLATNVATLLQRRTGGRSQASRKLKTVCLLPVSDSMDVEPFCAALIDHLSEHGETIAVSPDNLSDLGAPVTQATSATPAGTEALPDPLRHWLGDQEDDHDFVVYRCKAGDSGWSRFAIRQSDIVLFVADAASSPGEMTWVPSPPDGAFSSDANRVLVLLQKSRLEIRHTAAWLDVISVDYHLHVEKGLESDTARVARVVAGKATGLVLGGGAARGLAALGAYKALFEAGISVDWVGGTSIGSIMAAEIAMGWTPEYAIENSRKAFRGGKPFSDFTIPVYSLLRGRRMKRLLRSYLNYQLEDTAIPYYCVSTNLGRGVKNIHTRGSMVDAICASAALPGVIPPAVVDSELTVDGALLDNLPVDVMQERPVGRIIAVDVSSRVHYTVPFSEMPSPWAVLRGRWLPFARKHRVPRLTTLILKATEIGTLEHSRRHGEMADLLIDPPVRKFGMMDVGSFDAIVRAGYDRTRELLEGWS